ncbi:MAG: hypothetical protein D6731_17645 [Planctomycetota bacterium]|nr:MAG: hypothetical protein D6731_17645 [Planctomycetota bacterium]
MRLPDRRLSVDGSSREVRGVWVMARPLTVGEFAALIDSIPLGFGNRAKTSRARRRKLELAKYLRPYLLGGRSLPPGRMRLPNWASGRVVPGRREEPLRGLPQEVARELARALGLRLPTRHEWLLAASVGGTRLEGLRGEPLEWLAEEGWAGEGRERVRSYPPVDRVGVRFVLDRD